jgi:hypothetical protein
MLHVFYCFLADTMMKFASFETIVEMIYKYSIPVPKDQCSKSLQLGVSFAGGYVAGVFCAIVSHPADNLVSFLNNAKGATVGDVSTFSDIEFPEKHYFPPLVNVFETLFMFGFAGCEEARCVGSVHSWAASPYCHDWNTYRSSVGYL